MKYVWRYLPKVLGKHVVSSSEGAYRRALCGVAPLAHRPSHDVWQAEQSELDHRPACGTCEILLGKEEQLAAAALTQLGQEDGLI